MTKILRIDLQQSSCIDVFNNKKELKDALIDVHSIEYPKEKLKRMSLDELCNQFDWQYKLVSNKQAEQILEEAA